jgi:hypothetical protein
MLPDVPYAVSNHVTIPIELYLIIFQLLSPHDLTALCTVSRSFHDEARRLLYRHVDLHESSPEQLLLWSLRMAQDPHLGRLVRKLCLPCTIPSLSNNPHELETHTP